MSFLLYRNFYLRLVATALLSINAVNAAPITLANGFDIYNTGTSLSGSVDQIWYMTLNPFNGSSQASLDTVSYLSANNATSAWVGPSGIHVNAPESVYRIAIDIDLTGIDLASVNLSGFWVSDNQGLDILVNGNSTGQTNTGSHLSLPNAFPDNAFSLALSDGLIAGVNTIEFEWGNGPAGGAGSQNPNPTHVRVEFTEASATLVPIPAAAWLFGSALGFLGWMRRGL
jgi:hypothetical protein